MATERPGFCQRCYQEEVVRIAGDTNRAKNVFIDTSRMVFRCQIPKFTHDPNGFPIVILWDCEKKQEVTMQQKEYQEKRLRGEL